MHPLGHRAFELDQRWADEIVAPRIHLLERGAFDPRGRRRRLRQAVFEPLGQQVAGRVGHSKSPTLFVIPAKAGTQERLSASRAVSRWVPAFAGMTSLEETLKV